MASKQHLERVESPHLNSQTIGSFQRFVRPTLTLQHKRTSRNPVAYSGKPALRTTIRTPMADSGKPHLLVFPYPAQGHMLSLLDLTENLATRGISITILITPKNLSFLTPLLSKASSSNLPIKPLIFPFPKSPSIPAGIENAQNLPPASFGHIMEALATLYNPILNWFQTHPSPPIAILSDIFLGWTQNLATHLNIPRISFSPSGAFYYSTIRYLWLNMPEQDSENPNFPIQFPDVPQSPIFPWYQLSLIYRCYEKSNPQSEFIKEAMVANFSSWGLVLNTCYDLEGKYIDHIREMSEGRVWVVGPLLPPGIFSDKMEETMERGGSSSVPASEVLEWLDRQEKRSVVYVCFGSQSVLSKRQMEVLAAGLERSGAGFVWCVKESQAGLEDGEFGVVPAGFEERTGGRGVVIRGWAPQVLILKHGSVGAFLTHCGWNSVLESVVSGVPMLAWPMTADQFANARLLVEELGVGVKVCEGRDSVPDPSELARAIEKVVSGSGSERARATELRNSALSAVKEGGSSFSDLDGLVGELNKLMLTCC